MTDEHLLATTRIGRTAWQLECPCGWFDVSHSQEVTDHLWALHLLDPTMPTGRYRKFIEGWKHPVTGEGVTP